MGYEKYKGLYLVVDAHFQGRFAIRQIVGETAEFYKTITPLRPDEVVRLRRKATFKIIGAYHTHEVAERWQTVLTEEYAEIRNKAKDAYACVRDRARHVSVARGVS